MQNRGTAINEVASILESLQNDPEKATVLLEEEDRFCDCRSSHNQLVRLALAIETDAEEEVPAIPDDPNNWVRQLRDKIERLQHGHKEIRGDIRGLHGDFQVSASRSTSTRPSRIFRRVICARLGFLCENLSWALFSPFIFFFSPLLPYFVPQLLVRNARTALRKARLLDRNKNSDHLFTGEFSLAAL